MFDEQRSEAAIPADREPGRRTWRRARGERSSRSLGVVLWLSAFFFVTAAFPVEARDKPGPPPAPKVDQAQTAERILAADKLLAEHLKGLYLPDAARTARLVQARDRLRTLLSASGTSAQELSKMFGDLCGGIAGLNELLSEHPHLDLAGDWQAEGIQWQGAFRGGRPEQFLADAARIRAEDRDAPDTFIRRVELLWNHLRPRLKWDQKLQDRTGAALAALAAAAKSLPKENEFARGALLIAICAQRHRIALANPLLDFDRLLIAKAGPPLYSHQCDQYLGRHSVPGPGLVVLENWRKGKPQETVLLKDKLPVGSVHHPDLSYDGRRIAFAFCDHTEAVRENRRYWLYEIGADGNGLKRLTGGQDDALKTFENRKTVLIEDWDPCYLPDGGLLFISTRNQGFGRCHGGRYTPSYTLYRMEGDAGCIRPFSHGEANEWDPAVLQDGRVAFCRWDYINRHDVVYQSLWTIRPDGTAVAHLYGNQTRSPCMITNPLPIPGSRKVLALTTAHHGWSAGSAVVLDPSVGEDGPEPLMRITMDFGFPEGGENWRSGTTATPFPLSEEFHLAALTYAPFCGQGRANQIADFGVYLVDAFGNKVLLYRDPSVSSFSPIPLRPRPMPPALPSHLPSQPKGPWGTFFISDAANSRAGVPRDQIKALRVNRIHTQPRPGAAARGFVANEVVKGVLGTVPLNADGSAAFRAPSEVPLQLQLLDGQGRAVMTMRSFTFLQSGENQSCAGCHEPRLTSPQPTAPLKLMPLDLTPPDYGGDGRIFSFREVVQPVLDRNCIRCHGLDKTEGGINLLGSPVGRGFSQSYNSLCCEKKGYVRLAHRNSESIPSRPDDYFSRAGKLFGIIAEKHKDRVKLPKADLQRIVDWMDLNGQFCGYDGPQWRGSQAAGEEALRKHIAAVFGPALGKQPFPALVNDASLEDSRILKAPLAVEGGGWGQITPAWKNTNDPGYQTMLKLVRETIGAPVSVKKK
jgi:hypothetical protein